MLLGGRCDCDGRGGRTAGNERVIGGRVVVAVVAGATVAAAARTVVARHIVVAVRPPWRGAAGHAGLRVRIVIDVGTVRRRRRHRSCRTPTKKRVDKNKIILDFILRVLLSFFLICPISCRPLVSQTSKTTAISTDANDPNISPKHIPAKFQQQQQQNRTLFKFLTRPFLP